MVILLQQTTSKLAVANLWDTLPRSRPSVATWLSRCSDVLYGGSPVTQEDECHLSVIRDRSWKFIQSDYPLWSGWMESDDHYFLYEEMLLLLVVVRWRRKKHSRHCRLFTINHTPGWPENVQFWKSFYSGTRTRLGATLVRVKKARAVSFQGR